MTCWFGNHNYVEVKRADFTRVLLEPYWHEVGDFVGIEYHCTKCGKRKVVAV